MGAARVADTAAGAAVATQPGTAHHPDTTAFGCELAVLQAAEEWRLHPDGVGRVLADVTDVARYAENAGLIEQTTDHTGAPLFQLTRAGTARLERLANHTEEPGTGGLVNRLKRLALAWRRVRKGAPSDGPRENGVRSCLACGRQVDVGIGNAFDGEHELRCQHHS